MFEDELFGVGHYRKAKLYELACKTSHHIHSRHINFICEHFRRIEFISIWSLEFKSTANDPAVWSYSWTFLSSLLLPHIFLEPLFFAVSQSGGKFLDNASSGSLGYFRSSVSLYLECNGRLEVPTCIPGRNETQDFCLILEE